MNEIDFLSNSFYYFFSAVPQILGAVLALFGVFVLFKLQSLSTEIIGELPSFYNFLNTRTIQEDQDAEERRIDLWYDVEKGIRTKNIKALKTSVDANAPAIAKYKDIIGYTEKFYKVYSEYDWLIKQTIRASTFTAAIIITCLVILPLSGLIIPHPYLLYGLFTITVLSVARTFTMLVIILKKSIQ